MPQDDTKTDPKDSLPLENIMKNSGDAFPQKDIKLDPEDALLQENVQKHP